MTFFVQFSRTRKQYNPSDFYGTVASNQETANFSVDDKFSIRRVSSQPIFGGLQSKLSAFELIILCSFLLVDSFLAIRYFD